MGFLSNYLDARAIRTNSNYAAQVAAQQERDWLLQDRAANRSLIEDQIGAPAQAAIAPQEAIPQQTAPYQMAPNEMMEGEAPIQGLMDVTQEAQPAVAGQDAVAGTGLWDADPIQQQALTMRMGGSPLEDVRRSYTSVLGQQLNPSQRNPNLGLPSGMQRDSMTGGISWIPGYLEGKKQVASSGASSIDIGLGQEGSRIVSPEDKAEMGLDPTVPYFWNKQGTPTPVKKTNYSDAQLQATGYAERMRGTENEISKLESGGYDPSGLLQNMAGKTEFGSYVLSDDDQMYSAARKDWVRAKLRKESGAVIGDDEMKSEIGTYFPLPGDSAKTIRFKGQLRERAIKSMAKQSGGAYEYKEPEAQKPPKKGGAPAEKDPLGMRS